MPSTKPVSEKQTFIANKIIANPKIAEQNGHLWSVYHDMQLFEYVIKYNFNFYEIANRFQNLCNNYKKYEYSEDAIRLHWSFLHAMRLLGKPVDVDYYKEVKLRYENKEKELTLKAIHDEKIKKLTEEEDIKRMKEEIAKAEKEKNGVIEDKPKEEKKEKEKQEEKKEEVKEEEIKIENKVPLPEIKKETKVEIKKDENEPDFIKALFTKKIPQEIQDKLNQDKGKYTSDTNTFIKAGFWSSQKFKRVILQNQEYLLKQQIEELHVNLRYLIHQ